MSVEDACKFYKDFYSDFDEKRFEELLDFMKLEKSMKIDTLSKGMHEKLNLSLVLSRDAKLYVLDEPIAGVDPVARDQILDAIIKYYNEKVPCLTTHLVRDMENLFDEVVIFKRRRNFIRRNAELRKKRGNK